MREKFWERNGKHRNMDLAYPLDVWTISSMGVLIALAASVVIILVR